MTHRTLSPTYLKFMDLVQHGDDFLKIEILREARDWYRRALDLKVRSVKNEQVKAKIEECEKKLAFERRVIRILVTIAALFILLLVIFGQ